MAWHVAAMIRGDFKDFPALADLTGDVEAASGPTPDQLAHKLRLWKAVTEKRGD